MSYVQGGADFDAPKKSKTAFKAAIKDHPEQVYLYATSSMGPQFRGYASMLPDDVTFNVVGPNPYGDRSWYASVKVGVKGKLVVT